MKIIEKQVCKWGCLLVILLAFPSVFFNAVSATIFDPLTNKENYFVKAIEQSKLSNYGQGKIIAILDTGINDNNTELSGSIMAEYDFTTDSKVAIDNDGHGTKMASIIAANNNNKGMAGIAFNAKLIDAKVVDDTGSITNENIIKAIHFSVENGADVVNMSFSSGQYSELLKKTIDKYSEQGVIFVAAAGNDGSSSITYPAGYSGVTSVSSLKRGSNEKAIYANDSQHVDIWIEDGIWTYDGKKYSREIGTSEAAAVVSAYIYIPTHSITSSHGQPKVQDKYRLSQVQFNKEKYLFADKDENTSLNLMAQYYYYNNQAHNFINLTNKLGYFNLAGYTRNIAVDYQETKQFFNLKTYDDSDHYFVMLDLFRNYVELMKKEEYDTARAPDNTTTMLANLFSIIKKESYKEVIITLKNVGADANALANKKSKILVVKLLSDLLKENKGVYNKYTALLRKIGRFLFKDTLKNRNWVVMAGEKQYEKLAAEIDESGSSFKALKYFGYLISLIETSYEITKVWTNDVPEELALVEFFKVNALDFIFVMESLDKNAYVNNSPSHFASSFMNYVRQISSPARINEEIDNLQKHIKKDAIFQTSKHVVSFGINVLDMAKGNPYTSTIVKVAEAGYSEYQAYKVFTLYRELVTGLSEKAVLSDNYGYIQAEDIATNFASSFLVKKFSYYSTLYLQKFGSSNNEITNSIGTAMNLYKVSETGFSLDMAKMGLVSRIADSSSAALLGLIYGIPKAIVTNLREDEKGFEQYMEEHGFEEGDIGQIFSTYSDLITA